MLSLLKFNHSLNINIKRRSVKHALPLAATHLRFSNHWEGRKRTIAPAWIPNWKIINLRSLSQWLGQVWHLHRQSYFRINKAVIRKNNHNHLVIRGMTLYQPWRSYSILNNRFRSKTRIVVLTLRPPSQVWTSRISYRLLVLPLLLTSSLRPPTRKAYIKRLSIKIMSSQVQGLMLPCLFADRLRTIKA